MYDANSAASLIESYARWRLSRLGQITDALERQLLFEMIGPAAGKTFLDVGCGDGALASELARGGAIVTGLDADPVMIAAARRRTEAPASRLCFVEGQGEILPFDDATFDRVLAIAVLCFVRDPERLVAEMARVLKPGGRLVIAELGRWSLWAAYRRMRLGNPIWRAAAFRTPRELSSLARYAGLKTDALCGAIH